MPAVSKAQQQAAGAALAAKEKGTTKGLKGASKGMVKMSKAELEKIASTKHKGLPKHVKESVEETHMMGHDHPGCDDQVGQIFVVLKPTPGASPENLVQQTHAFGMHQHDPMNIHGIYGDEGQAISVAEAACTEMYKHLEEVEKKKHEVTEKIEKTIEMLQKEVNRCMEEGQDGRAQQVLQKISELRSKHQMVEASKKPIEDIDPKKKIEEGWLDRTTAKLKGTGAQIGTGFGNLKAYLKGDKEAIKDPVLAKNMAMLQQKARTLDKDLTGVYADILKLFPQEKLDKNPAFGPVYKKYTDLIKATREMSNQIASGNIGSSAPAGEPDQSEKPEGGESQQKSSEEKPEQKPQDTKSEKQDVPNAKIKYQDKDYQVQIDPATKKLSVKGLTVGGQSLPVIKDKKSGRYYATIEHQGKQYPILRDPVTKSAYIKVNGKKLEVGTKK